MSGRQGNERLPPQALTFIVWNAISHLNFLTAARDIATVAGRDGWLGTVLSFVLIAFAVWIPIHVTRMFPGQTLVEISQTVLGRFVGSALPLMYAVYWMAIGSWALLIHSHLFMVTLLPDTPRWILNAYLLLVSTYLVRHGLEPMARFFILAIPAFVVPLAIAFIVGFTDADFGRLRPVLADGFGPLARGTWMSFVQASGLSVLWMVGAHLTRFRGAVRAAMLGVAFVAVPGILMVTLLSARLGFREVAAQLYPPLVLIELLEIPGFTGFHINALFLAVWLVIAFLSVALLQYAAASVVARLLRLQDIVWPVLATTAVLLIGGNLPISEIYLLEWAETVRPYSVGVTALLVPIILWIGASWHKARGKKGGGT